MPLGEIAPGTTVRHHARPPRRAGPAAPARRARRSAPASTSQLAVERRRRRAWRSIRGRSRSTPRRCASAAWSAPSLYRSARAAGRAGERGRSSTCARSAQQVSLDSGIAAGDEFDMIVDYKRAATGESEAGKLLYAGLERDGKPRTQLMRWGSDGAVLRGLGRRRAAARGLLAPVAGPGHLGLRHAPPPDPRLRAGCTPGIDFGAAYGSPIFAVDRRRRCTFAGRHGGHGNYVRLEHGGGLGTGYAPHEPHRGLAGRARAARPGDRLRRLDRALDRAAPALRDVPQTAATVNPLGVSFVTRAQLVGQRAGRVPRTPRRAARRSRPAPRSRASRPIERRAASRCARSTGSTARVASASARLRRARGFRQEPARMTAHLPRHSACAAPAPRAWSRALHRETVLTPADLIWPLFVTEGSGVEEPIASLPGVSRWSVDGIAARAKEAVALGIPCVALFPNTQPDRRSDDGARGAQSRQPDVPRDPGDPRRLRRRHRRADRRRARSLHQPRPGRADRRRRLRAQRRDGRGAGRPGAQPGRGGRRHHRAVGHDGRPRRRDPRGAREARATPTSRS